MNTAIIGGIPSKTCLQAKIMKSNCIQGIVSVFLVAGAFGQGVSTPSLEALKTALNEPKVWYPMVKQMDEESLFRALSTSWIGSDAIGQRRQGSLLRPLAKANPKRAIQWLNENHATSRYLWQEAIRGWADLDPSDALNFVKNWAQENTETTQTNLAQALFDVTIKAKLTSWIAENITTLDRDLQYGGMASQTWAWAILDPEFATRWIISYGDDAPRRATYVCSAFAQWSRQDPDAAWSVVESLDSNTYEAALSGFARGIAIADVEEGALFLRALKDSGRTLSVLHTIGLECGAQHLETGRQLWEIIESDEDADIFAGAYLQRLAQNKPAIAADLLRHVSSPEIQATLAHDIARSWKRKDIPATQAWISTITDKTIKMSAADGFNE